MSAWAIMAPAWPQPIEEIFEFLEPSRLLERADHLQAQRFAQAEGAIEHAAIEAGDDQHRLLETFVGQEPQQLDAVHSRHAEIERDHFGRWARNSSRNPASLIGDGRIVAAESAAFATKAANAGSSSIRSNLGNVISDDLPRSIAPRQVAPHRLIEAGSNS